MVDRRVSSSKHPGIRWRLHPSRKHGATPDRYYIIRFQFNGERREEALGWASEGWTEAKAAIELERLKQAARIGEGPTRLAERRALAEAKRQAEQEARDREARESLTFSEFWKDTYFPQAKKDKSRGSYEREDQFFRLWLEPVLGQVPLRGVSPIHLERVKKNMADAGRAPRSIQYCLAVARQVFNHARRLGLYQGDSPTNKIKKPTPNNQRLRFFTPAEAQALLEALATASPDVHDMALVSLHTGARAGEVRNLAWGDVDLGQKLLTLRDTKTGPTRHVFIDAAVEVALLARQPKQPKPSTLVFAGSDGKPRSPVAKTFRNVANRLGLNEGIADRRQRLTFHSLRHSFASWLVMEGVPLYTVGRLLGHKTAAMTARYAHLAPDHMREAANGITRTLERENTCSGNLCRVK